MANFKVHVSKDYLVFCAAHFVTYDGESEPLHGHLPNLTACEMEVSEVEGQSALYREEWR